MIGKLVSLKNTIEVTQLLERRSLKSDLAKMILYMPVIFMHLFIMKQASAGKIAREWLGVASAI